MIFTVNGIVAEISRWQIPETLRYLRSVTMPMGDEPVLDTNVSRCAPYRQLVRELLAA